MHVKIFAQLSDQGTACSETALCERCVRDEANKCYAQEMGSQSGDIPDLHTFHDCSGNDALRCCICGQSIYGEQPSNE